MTPSDRSTRTLRWSPFLAPAAALVLALLSPVLLHGQAPAAGTALQPLAWMSGSWVLTRGETTFEEHWTAPAGGMMIGMNRTVRGDRAVMFEFLRIAAHGDSIAYVAQPRGRAETVFPLTEMSVVRVVFENPDHDFPQRIIYWLDKPDELHARIEGTMDGKPNSSEWYWKRSTLTP